MALINYASRRNAMQSLDVGQSILLFPAPGLTVAKETSSILVTALRLGYKVSVKSSLLVVEGEVSQRVLRVTRLSDD